MSLAINCLILAGCFAFFVQSYRWLIKLLRRRAAPHPVTYYQRWLAGFISVLPLCGFAGYAIFHSFASAVLLSIGFGLGGAAFAAASCLPLLSSLSSVGSAPYDSHNEQ